VCFLVTLTAVLIYSRFGENLRRARVRSAAAIVGIVLLLSVGLRIFGPSGMAAAASPAIFSVAAMIALLVPPLVDRPRSSWFATVTIVVLGLIEIIAFAGALSTEGIVGAPTTLAFDIPHNLFDVQQKFIDLPRGAHIHYVDEGQGETILFLHGNPSWSFQWRDLIMGLRGSYRCVTLDYPGFGLSTANAGFGYTPLEESRVVEEFVDRLGLHNVTLVMQDWGGPIGLGLAERRPNPIRGIFSVVPGHGRHPRVNLGGNSQFSSADPSVSSSS